MATGWGGIWGTNGSETGEYLINTEGFSFPHPLPFSQNGYGGFWLDKSSNESKREGIMNQLQVPILGSSGCYSLEFKIACLGGEFGVPVLQIFGVPVGALPTLLPITQASPLNENLFLPAAIPLGEYSIDIDSCDNNFMTVTIDFDSNNLPAGGIDRIFFTRNDLPVTPSRGVYIALDDICLTPAPCMPMCTCPPSNVEFTLSDGMNSYSIFCSSPLIPIPTLACPVGNIAISGNFGCVSSTINGICPPNAISWILDRPTQADLSGTLTGPAFNWSALASNVSDPGLYILQLKTVCNGDTCVCVLRWNQRDCNVCLCPSTTASFTIKQGNNAVNVTCGQPISAIPTLACPVGNIAVSGNFGCVSSTISGTCPLNAISWELDRPISSNLSGTTTGPSFNITFSVADASEAGLYSLTVSTICGSDTCVCVMKWVQTECLQDTCCKDFQSFIQRSEDAITVGLDATNCKIILNIDSLSTCDSIERIIWGDGTITSGPLSGGQMYMHTYVGTGVKNINIWFNEYNANDSVCFRYKVDKSVFLNCIKEPTCDCNSSFNHTFFQPMNGPLVTANCNGNSVLIPCPSSRTLTFFGSFNCTMDCPPSNPTYKIINIATGLTIVSGSLNMPNFSIPIVGSWFDPAGGLYCIELSGQCGTSNCTCKINFKVPPCPQLCLCDPSFDADVLVGFHTNGNILSCKKEFIPKRLCPKDMVTWTLNGVAVATSIGVTSTQFNVNPGTNLVCMIVERLDINNKKCKDTICQRVYCRKRLCPPTTGPGKPNNGDFEFSKEGVLPDFGNVEYWTLSKGEGYVFATEGVDNGNVLLTSKINAPAELRQECCLDIQNNNNLTLVTMDIQNFDTEKVPLGTTVQIISQEFENGGKREILGTKELSFLSSIWEEISFPLTPTAQKYPYLIVQLHNPNVHEANIRIDNLCFDYVSGTSDIVNTEYTIYPNPTTGHLNIQFTTSVDEDISLKVMDILGRELSIGTISKGSSSHNFSIDDMAGIYIIQLIDSSGNFSQRKVIKLE